MIKNLGFYILLPEKEPCSCRIFKVQQEALLSLFSKLPSCHSFSNTYTIISILFVNTLSNLGRYMHFYAFFCQRETHFMHLSSNEFCCQPVFFLRYPLVFQEHFCLYLYLVGVASFGRRYDSPGRDVSSRRKGGDLKIILYSYQVKMVIFLIYQYFVFRCCTGRDYLGFNRPWLYGEAYIGDFRVTALFTNEIIMDPSKFSAPSNYFFHFASFEDD